MSLMAGRVYIDKHSDLSHMSPFKVFAKKGVDARDGYWEV